MSQKPVDKRGNLDTREALWKVMLELKEFTAPELARHTRYHASTLSDYLKGLLAAGVVTLMPCTRHPVYCIDPATAPGLPPRVRKDGTLITQGAGRKNLWRTAKIMGEFSVVDLQVFASTDKVRISENEAADYVHYLVKAGYLTILKPARTRGGRARYRFDMSRYTGPQPPQVQRVRQVYDPNIGKVVWSGGTDGK